MTENDEEIKDKQPQDGRKEPETDKQAQDKKADRVGWIRFALVLVLVLIPIIIGVVCLTVGNRTNNNTVSFVGMLAFEAGVPAVMLILVIALLIWKFGGAGKSKSDKTNTTDNNTPTTDEVRSDEASEETPSQREHEQNMIDAVNSSHYYSGRARMAAYETEHVAEGMKHAPKWGLPVGIGMFLLLVADIVVATVLAIKGIFIGTIICVALFAGFVITGLIVMSISRAKAANGDIRKAKKITEGKVKACFMIGTATTKSGGMRHGNGGTVRIQSVTYRVIVIADGKEYGAYSKQFYETDETVTVGIMSKTRAKIAEGSDLEKIDRTKQ